MLRGRQLSHQCRKDDIENQNHHDRDYAAICGDIHIILFPVERADHIYIAVRIQECVEYRVGKRIHDEYPDQFHQRTEPRRHHEQKKCAQPHTGHAPFIWTSLAPAGVRPVDEVPRKKIRQAVEKFAQQQQGSHCSRRNTHGVGTENCQVSHNHRGDTSRTASRRPRKKLPEPHALFFFLRYGLCLRLYFSFSSHICLPLPFFTSSIAFSIRSRSIRTYSPFCFFMTQFVKKKNAPVELRCACGLIYLLKICV